VWYRLKSQESDLNVVLPSSSRKAYLNAKNQRVIETFVKVDPTKAHFFRNVAALQVELEVTVRNANGTDDPQNRDAVRRVHYAANQATAVGTQSNDFDEDDRDDDEAYASYNTGSPTNFGQYDSRGAAVDEHLVDLLLQPQQNNSDENNDNDSTGAVQDEAGAGVSRQNSGEQDFGIALRCNAC
jgi:hypothetical protein